MVTIFSVDISPKGTIDSPKGGTIAREQFSFTLPHDNIKRRNSCHSLYYLCETVAPPIRRYSSVILPSEQVEHGSDHEDYSSDHSSNEAYEESNNLLQDQLHRSGHADTVSDLFRCCKSCLAFCCYCHCIASRIFQYLPQIRETFFFISLFIYT